MNWLEKILASKKHEVASWKAGTPQSALEKAAANRLDVPDFRAALAGRPMGLIAEVKHRSPSAGILRESFQPAVIARAYEKGGAQALSVLIDQPFFGGGPEAFREVREAVSLPLLYKEFVIDPWQVWHAASLGASAVLLIVAALERRTLEALMAEIARARLQALVEVHDEEEAAVAVDAGARIIGINNRDLKAFVTSLETTARVIRGIPADRLVVSESGIRTSADIEYLKGLGVHAVLVGEHLLRKPDLAGAVRDLMESAWTSS